MPTAWQHRECRRTFITHPCVKSKSLSTTSLLSRWGRGRTNREPAWGVWVREAQEGGGSFLDGAEADDGFEQITATKGPWPDVGPGDSAEAGLELRIHQAVLPGPDRVEPRAGLGRPSNGGGLVGSRACSWPFWFPCLPCWGSWASCCPSLSLSLDLALGEDKLFQLAVGLKEKTANTQEILFPLFSSTNQHDQR